MPLINEGIFNSKGCLYMNASIFNGSKGVFNSEGDSFVDFPHDVSRSELDIMISHLSGTPSFRTKVLDLLDDLQGKIDNFLSVIRPVLRCTKDLAKLYFILKSISSNL